MQQGQFNPLAESDPQGLESTTEVDLGLEIPSRDGAARASVGLWAVTLPCTPQCNAFFHALLIQCADVNSPNNAALTGIPPVGLLLKLRDADPWGKKRLPFSRSVCPVLGALSLCSG